MTKISEVINSLNDIKKNFGDVAVGTPELGIRDNDAWRINVAMNDEHKVYATMESYPCDDLQDKKYHRMVSEIVNRLSELMEKHGDIPVSTPEVDPYDEDYFNWDISAKMDDDENCQVSMEYTADEKISLKYRPDVSQNEIVQNERDAKMAVHDRIVDRNARSFTPEQIDALKRYSSMFTENTPAGELYLGLYKDAIADSDVARCPEKWRLDTLRELIDIAEGITRDQGRGIHM